jgi:hypothetical protein
MTTALKLEEFTDLLNDCKLLKKACPKETVFLKGGRSYTAHITSPSIVQPSVQVPKFLGTQGTKKFQVQLELLYPLPFTWL